MTQTTPTTDVSQQLWAQYTAAIASQLGAGAGSASIQVLPSAQLIDGADADDLTTSLQKFAEVIPQWGAIYNPSSSVVVDAYQIVLTQMQETKTNGTQIEDEYNTESAKLTAMMGKASTFKTTQLKAYIAAAAMYKDAGIDPPTFPDWFADNGQEAYKAMIDDQTKQSKTVSDLLEAEGIASPLVEALAALNTALDANQDKLSMPLTVNPDASVLAAWVTKPTNPTSLSFNDTSTQYDYSKSTWNSHSGTELFGFISIGDRSESSTKTNVFNSSTNYTIQVDFDAQATINITQGDWFNGAILKTYKSGPWVSGSQFDTKAAHPYGDADAVLPMLVTRLYVVMNPTITITQVKADSSSLFSQLNTSFKDGVNLGGFAFGGSENNSSTINQSTTTDSNTMKITITDKSNIPQIIAIANQLMP